VRNPLIAAAQPGERGLQVEGFGADGADGFEIGQMGIDHIHHIDIVEDLDAGLL
jgi:hypothetical protein